MRLAIFVLILALPCDVVHAQPVGCQVGVAAQGEQTCTQTDHTDDGTWSLRTCAYATNLWVWFDPRPTGFAQVWQGESFCTYTRLEVTVYCLHPLNGQILTRSANTDYRWLAPGDVLFQPYVRCAQGTEHVMTKGTRRVLYVAPHWR